MIAADGTVADPVLSEEAQRLLKAYGSAEFSYAWRQAADLPGNMVEEAERKLPPALAAIWNHIAALEAETLSARRELFAWKAQFAHRQRMKAGVRSAVTWLHRRADSMRDSRACGILHSAATNLGWELARVGPEGLGVAERATQKQRHRAQDAEAEAMALEADLSRLRQAPKVEFHHHDFIPGFAAFLPNATTPAPDSRAFCVLNLGSLLAGVHLGDVPASDIPYAVAECMMHEVMHALEQWAGVEFSEDRVEALLEKYRAHVDAEGDEEEPRPLLGREQLDAFVRMGEAGGWLEPVQPSRPVTGFFSSLTPEQKAAALAYRGPENIGEEVFRLDAEDGPACQVHAGDGGGAAWRRLVEDRPSAALVGLMRLPHEVAAVAEALNEEEEERRLMHAASDPLSKLIHQTRMFAAIERREAIEQIASRVVAED